MNICTSKIGEYDPTVEIALSILNGSELQRLPDNPSILLVAQMNINSNSPCKLYVLAISTSNDNRSFVRKPNRDIFRLINGNHSSPESVMVWAFCFTQFASSTDPNLKNPLN